MSEIKLEDNGDIIFLARAPGQVADNSQGSGASVIRGTKSGNPNFDPATGRFGGKTGGAKVDPAAAVEPNPIVVNRLGIPQGVTPEQWDKRIDIIRDAAREFDGMDAGDAQEFLKGRVNDLSQVNVEQFLVDVKAQRLDDLIDIFDHQLRGKVAGMMRSRRYVRVQAPKGWVNRVFAGLDDGDVQKLVTRLIDRGWKTADLKKYVVGKIKDEGRRNLLEQSIS